MDINQIANKARNSISKYCVEECKAFCCRKGFIDVTLKERDLIAHGNLVELEKSETFVRIDEVSYLLDLRNTCPCLQDNICTIHTNKGRPKVCKDFPIFIDGNNVRLMETCPAVRDNLFYAYEAKFLKLGYKLTLPVH